MTEQKRIIKLSENFSTRDRQGSAVVMVGSFAPVHRGHFDAVKAASAALLERDIPVEALVLTPNSAEYVRRKLGREHVSWTHERRVEKILEQDPHPHISTYVDDVSGPTARHEQINNHVPVTLSQRLGFQAYQMYLVVGSDQLPTMEEHLDNELNRAVCVLRPGSIESVKESLTTSWVINAMRSNRLIVTKREDMNTDVSSTAVRRATVIE
jgi:nicotinic acid mononucleotide adenylyltransferase